MFYPVLMLALAGLARPAPSDYERDVKPLLSRRCVPCHGPLRQEGGLRLDVAALAHRGGDSGPAVEPGDASRSLILARILAPDDSERMPQEAEPLPADEVDVLRRWIAAGAAFPASEEPVASPRDHWSYQSVSRPAVPVVASRRWIRNPIDAFVVGKLQAIGRSPAPPAPPAILARRLFLDLVGRPPTRDELTRFVGDQQPDAYERLVDSLLASPEYGQRWGRHWMDIWRYSDWYGRRDQDEIRYSQRHIWRWRDWMIDSLNKDRSYAGMITEMLAGDEVAPTDANVVRATGFLGRNWYKFDRNTWLFDTVEHTSAGILAVTMRCARCHDHKYEPITQEDYYRFRAFFEPHDVRIDSLPGEPHGVARVYDAHADAETFRFERGDDRRPDHERPLSAGVPRMLDKSPPVIRPVPLPAEAYYPGLRPDAVARLRHQADERVRESLDERAKIDLELARLKRQHESLQAGETPAPSGEILLFDDFSRPREDLWSVRSGIWKSDGEQLVQSEVGPFRSMVSQTPIGGDFQARIRYTTTDPGSIHSVGFSFDANTAATDWQAVYTHIQNGKAAVHAFHRQGGRDVYPSAAIVDCSLEIGIPVVLDIAVRGTKLNVWVDGQLKLAYDLPVSRRAGLVGVWVHSGTASFDELRIESLPEHWVPANSADAPHPSPFVPWTLERLSAQQALLAGHLPVADCRHAAALADRAAVEARIEAARAGTAGREDAGELAQHAARAERLAAVAAQEAVAAAAERALDVARSTAGPHLPQLQADLAKAHKQLEQARAAVLQPGSEFQPLGDVYPNTSTGRRLALARWITDDKNPRTARVAVNHIWLRHMGTAIVPTVANFGISGQAPSHPELLDWLAVELAANGWSMKHLHRLMVTSAAYRASSDSSVAAAGDLDPQNRLLSRMNIRRMEAEVVRDSLLALAGLLDVSLGGPELDEQLGQSSSRRSLYFRTTPDNKMQLLDLFDLANPNQCYERNHSVLPQQALALFNSPLALRVAAEVSRRLSRDVGGRPGDRRAFVVAAYETVLCRSPEDDELETCLSFVTRHTALQSAGDDWEPLARERLILVLINHNDFVTIR